MTEEYTAKAVSLTDIPQGAPKRRGPFEKLLADIMSKMVNDINEVAYKIDVKPEDISKARASINRTIRRFKYNLKMIVREDAIYIVKNLR